MTPSFHYMHKILFFICLLGCVGQGATQAMDRPLKGWRVYPIEYSEPLQPSGLTLLDGQLYTVCDKHNDIYRLEFDGDVVRARVHTRLGAAFAADGKLDLEGISHDDQGHFYLLSEAHNRLIRVTADGAQWHTGAGELLALGQSQGLLQKHNAMLEAVLWLGPDHFLLAAEREPRGLLEVRVAGDVLTPLHVSMYEHSLHPRRSDRNLDFAGLAMHDGAVYVLQRNAERVTRLDRAQAGFTEGDSWRFDEIVAREEYRYLDTRYGHAEGLAVDAAHFYIVLDNGYSPRQADVKDIRPLLLVLER